MLNRVFKTSSFATNAKKAHITDAELCCAIHEVIKGQAEDLGGGVWKKRLNENRHRSILLAKGGSYWVYQHLFAKQDKANINRSELAAFRQLAKVYEGLTALQVNALLHRKEFMEICNG